MEKSREDLFPKTPAPERSRRAQIERALLKKAPALLWTTDQELRFTALAGAELQNIGVRAGSYVGAKLDSTFVGSSLVSLNAHRKALEGLSSNFEIDLTGRDLSARVEPLCDPDGKIIGVVGVAHDNTTRLVAHRTLRLSERSSCLLLEEIPYAICRATRTGQLLQVNRAMLEMLLYDAESEAELLVRNLPHNIFAAKGTFDEFLARLLDCDVVRGFESRWRCRSGEEIDVLVGGRVIRDAEGEIWYFDILAENVTERNQLESRLRQAQKMQAIGQLAGGIAHDFNNLLMVIRGQVELLLSESVAPESLHRLEEVMRASDRASSLTTQLMAFSRTQTLQSKVLDVNLVIKQMNPLLAPLVSQSIDLSFIPARGTACVRIDASQIEQVIMNLATNARDAMPQGGRLTIQVSNVVYDGEAARSSTGKSANYVLIAVKDTGHGMDEATQSRIFEPFFSTKEPGRGTGLGLSLVYGVVRQNGGQIMVESEQGKGTTFKIYLPHVADPLPDSGKKASLNLPKGNETILYAEDEGSVRELVSEYLTSLGYRVLPASDGVNAMQVAQSHLGEIDLLLTDMMMPRLGGRELAEELRKIIPALRVVFVSGYVGHSLVAKNLELPNTYFLPKPFSMQSLAKTIREGLDR